MSEHFKLPGSPGRRSIPEMRKLIRGLVKEWRYGEPVVVVSGLPRSGTSMLMRMLVEGGVPILTDGSRMPDHHNPYGYFEYERVKDLNHEADKSWVRNARGKGIKVISHLLRHLPDDNFYRVIVLHRDLREVLASQSLLLAHSGEPDPLTDERTLALYQQHLANLEVFVEHKRNFEKLDVNYRDVLANPRRCADRLNFFLGGRCAPEQMVRAIDDRLYRNREASGACG